MNHTRHAFLCRLAPDWLGAGSVRFFSVDPPEDDASQPDRTVRLVKGSSRRARSIARPSGPSPEAPAMLGRAQGEQLPPTDYTASRISPIPFVA